MTASCEHRLAVVIELSLSSPGWPWWTRWHLPPDLVLGPVGQGLIYDLRTKVFRHVQQQPLAFFTRAQTGSLVSRLNTDVIGAQQAVTSLLSQAVSAILTLILVLAAMFYLSWQITLASVVIVPFFLLPARLIGKRLQRLTREGMQLDAETGLDDERAVQRGRRDAHQALRPRRTRRPTCSRAGRAGSATSAS